MSTVVTDLQGAVEDVADVVEQAADEPPRHRHWMHRNLIGRS